MYFKLALGNVRKSIRDYGIYFLTLVFGVCVFYAFNSIKEQNAVLILNNSQNQMLELISSLIGGVSIFIAVVLGFLIVYASRYLIRRRKKEFGTYLMLGMPAGKVSRIIVYETLSVGLISLVVGLIAGVALSQVLLYITAAMFKVEMDMFVFIFSFDSLTLTILCFGVVFLVALFFNAVSVSRYKLIDLITAERKNEGVKLRSLALSMILFIISLVLIGIAYYLLIDNGMRVIDDQFGAATALVCVGTVLFFFSLSGFLLRAVQMNKKLYFKGLNMFTLRQLSSKINTAFLSISMVCIALFLAITSTCGGFAIVAAFNNNISDTTPYDASFISFFGGTPHITAELNPDDEWFALAEADDYDIEKALSQKVENWNELISATGQSVFYHSDVTEYEIMESTDFEMSNSLYMEGAEEQYLQLTSISDLNAQLVLLGQEPIELANDEYLFWCDFEELQGLYEAYADQVGALYTQGTTLYPSNNPLVTIKSETSPAKSSSRGTIVVPDGVISEQARPYFILLNVMYNGDKEETDALLTKALEGSFDEETGWPVSRAITAVEVYNQNVGVTAMVTYLAIYIGFILLITCAAILALQQLSESADNADRYALLEKIGADRKMMNAALAAQIGIYFVFPLILALCHSFVALSVVTKVVTLLGNMDIVSPLVITMLLFIVVYGGYYLITYFASRTMIHQRTKA